MTFYPVRRFLQRYFCLGVAVGLCLSVSGCAHKPQPVVYIPPTPEISAPSASPSPSGSGRVEESKPKQPEVSPSAKPIYVETGLASWYGPPYQNRRGANGEIFDTNQFTAAHKTLPLNSVARITNLQTGRSAVVRITDRGPFVGDRLVDLSLAAAKATDVWQPGVAPVRLEVLSAPASIDHGGRWAVQIGAFSRMEYAAKLKEKLARRYQTAKVLEFTGPTGEWLRVRVANDDKSRAQELARDTHTPEGQVFLVRLD